jgi:phospholipase/carboxylesterase
MPEFSLDFVKRQAKTNQTNPPLLVMLHGYGSNEEDLFSFAEELPDELLIISARAPMVLGFGSYAWYTINFESGNNNFSDIPEAKKALDLIDRFLSEIISAFQVDEQNIFLLGFSQGTILSTAYALNHPQKIQHVIALSGYVNEQLIQKPLEKESFKKLDFFVSHGVVDQVIPVDWARKTPDYLNKLNIAHSYKEYPVGHGVSPQNFYDLHAWIKQRC